MKYPSKGTEILRDAGTAFEGTDIDADDYSQWYDLDDCSFFGLALALGTVTGTSPTLTIQVECRFGGDANIYKYPANENLETVSDEATNVAAMAEIGDEDDTNRLMFWKNVLPSAGENGQIRFFFDIGGTTPVFPCQQAVLLKVER